MHTEEEALELVRMFLATPFSGEERHARRIRLLAEYETAAADPLAAGGPTGVGPLALSAGLARRTPAVDPGEQLVDHLVGDPLVVGVGARHVPRSHGTVQGDQPRGAIPPEIARP